MGHNVYYYYLSNIYYYPRHTCIQRFFFSLKRWIFIKKGAFKKAENRFVFSAWTNFKPFQINGKVRAWGEWSWCRKWTELPCLHRIVFVILNFNLDGQRLCFVEPEVTGQRLVENMPACPCPQLVSYEYLGLALYRMYKMKSWRYHHLVQKKCCHFTTKGGNGCL